MKYVCMTDGQPVGVAWWQRMQLLTDRRRLDDASRGTRFCPPNHMFLDSLSKNLRLSMAIIRLVSTVLRLAAFTGERGA